MNTSSYLLTKCSFHGFFDIVDSISSFDSAIAFSVFGVFSCFVTIPRSGCKSRPSR